MIIQEKVTLIVTVCRLDEGGRPKCHQYWPDKDSKKESELNQLLTSGLTVTKQSEKLLGPTLFDRLFEVRNGKGGQHFVR